MNCQEALELLYDYLDKETSEIDARQVQEHLEHCKHCFDRYQVEADVNSFIKQKLSNTAPTHIDPLRKKILAQLDEIDREEGAVTGRKPPFWNLSVTLAAAALLVLVIGAAFLVAGLYRHHVVFGPLEDAHFNAATPAAFADINATNDAMTFATGAGYRVNSSAMGYRLVGGRTEDIQGARMAHFVYVDSSATSARASVGAAGSSSSEDNIVSVFVMPAGTYTIPESLQKSPIEHNGSTYYDHHCRGCHLVYHQVGNSLIITASTNHSADLYDFIPGESKS